jgi:predicted nucleic acid-binding protein
MGQFALNLLVDSVLLIDHLSGNTHATEFLAQNRHKASVSVITRAEVLVGAREHDIAAITRLLDALPTLGIDREAADSAATLRREHNLRLPDAFQAALAIQHGLRLATRDTRHLSQEVFPFVLVPYEL